ncbi:ABC transporter substrate-binding protein [Thermodesulfobacteriota bacterium]
MRWGVLILSLALGVMGLPAEAEDPLYRVGISQIVEHPALDDSRKGFVDQLKDRGLVPGKNLTIDYKNAQNNRAVSGQIARRFVGEKSSLIMTISTPSSLDAAALTKVIPILFCAVTDPVAVGLVKSLEKPGGNVSGTTDRSPVSKQLDLILEILPKAKTIGTIYNAGEGNSVASVKQIKDAAEKRGIKVIEATAATSSAIKMAAESLVGRVDLIHVPTDNTVVLAFESVFKVCRDNKIPLFAADVDSVKRGAIAALAIDYYKLGRQTGEMAYKVLKEKAKISDLPVESQKELLLHINLKAAQAMGVELPKAIIDRASKKIQ